MSTRYRPTEPRTRRNSYRHVALFSIAVTGFLFDRPRHGRNIWAGAGILDPYRGRGFPLQAANAGRYMRQHGPWTAYAYLTTENGPSCLFSHGAMHV